MCIKIVGYNEKNPSGLKKVALCPPLRITLIFDTFPGRPNPLAPISAKTKSSVVCIRAWKIKLYEDDAR